MSFRIAAAAAFVLLMGCRSVPVVTPLPEEDPRPAAFLRTLATQREERQALRGVARVALEGPAGQSRSKQILALQRPSRLRIEVQGFLGQLVAVLVSDGDRFELFRAQDRSVERGSIHPGLLYEVAGLPLRPEDAVELLLGVPDLGPRPHPGASAALSNGELRIDLVEEDGVGLRRITFDARALLARLEVGRPGGEPAWEAAYGDYRPVGDSWFAHRLALEFPGVEARAEISFQHVELNPELPAELFALGLPVAAGGAR